MISNKKIPGILSDRLFKYPKRQSDNLPILPIGVSKDISLQFLVLCNSDNAPTLWKNIYTLCSMFFLMEKRIAYSH
jgi:hypothetical protein